MDVQLAVDVGQMRLDRALGELQGLAHVLPRVAFDQQRQHFSFSRGESIVFRHMDAPFFERMLQGMSVDAGSQALLPLQGELVDRVLVA